ncbi:MAG TPA: hypothetical protein PK570_00765 [Thermoanaerobaculia bacterium]|nr:hypothetical protein [Thermoanaerobaculia bacterium]MDI9630816.1 hypothetical protein [Acidobacteriota bacterium]MBP7812610.1 hypothetical protein [Thermoanaerobaculia bacterium]MBP8844266.1 hypothetical protein [Thermoanaerobaculia bacterium]HPA95099.1 hypothetical protein [Thermoanaerobaculia bacterium]
MYRLLRSLPLLLLAAAFAGCGGEPPLDVEVAAGTATPAAARPDELPPGHPPVGTPAVPPLPAGHPPLPADGAAAAPATGALMPVVAPGGEGAMALLWTAPASWVAETPANPMRRGQYRVPGPGGDAECAVFYFGPGQGGDPQSNVERWASQFVTEDGRPGSAVMQTRELATGDAKILVVETKGTFMAGSMMGMPSQPRPGQALLGAVVEGPDAYWFFKLTGPAATVEAQREPFDAMLRSVRRGG